MPDLKLDSLVVDARGTGVRFRLDPVRLGTLRIGLRIGLELGFALVLQRPRLARTGAFGPGAHLDGLIMIGDTCKVPSAVERNQRRPPF